MDTTQQSKQPEQPGVRIRVTPLRRLSGGAYVPRGSRAATAQAVPAADDGACTRGREQTARTGARRPARD
ncbi:hypothetical protein [Streptomyces sp. NPDC006285]|uniref:hypothetical protein n=1 Tax=Streptomyces sp. NPDC006285 TaxID=3364742 RepID=UPI0036CC6AC3